MTTFDPYEGRESECAIRIPARRESSGMNGRSEWLWRLGTAALAAVLAYGALSVRVSVLETRVDSLTEYVREIRADVKTLLNRR